MELHFEVKAVGKGAKGRTACGSSAYRACDNVVDNAGNVHNYRHKGGYVSGGVELPQGASEDLRDRQTLWSRHEKKDIRKDAELFREIVASLPNELDTAASERVARGLAAKLTEQGMCVQWDIHDKTNKEGQRNLHVHLMLTMRELLPDGTFGNKNRSWNRYNGGLNIAEMLRPEAARLMNEELAAIGAEKHVEHESYAERGIDKIPTSHLGVAAAAMERKGMKTRKGNWNRYIDRLNEIHAQNLREFEQKTMRLDKLIAKAETIKNGDEAYKDWDALFALLRDIRRARAAIKSEKSKLGKVISAYEEQNVDYLRWAGFDPNNPGLRLALRETQEELQVLIKQLDMSEEMVLDSKELLKVHNRAVYNSKKAEWEQYQIERKGRSLAYFQQRLKSLGGYIQHLKQSISLMDVLFNTYEYQAYARKIQALDEERGKILAEYQKTKAEILQHKKDLKEHKKGAAEAARAKKKLDNGAR